MKVSGGFHSPLMQPIATQLEEVLKNAEMKDAEIPLIANVTARPVTQASQLRQLLALQLTSQVRWVESVLWLWENGVRVFVEVGPRRVLSQLVLQTIPEASVMQAEDPQGIEKVINTLHSKRT